MSDEIFAGLNPEQCKAVEILSGPLLILAGAGSGKTKTLTHRIAHLIAQGIPADKILAVTFTNKAAGEMKERIARILGGGRLPTVGTFHSVCVRILREDIEKMNCGLTRNFVIFDTDDSQKLVKMILKDLQIDEKEFKPKPIGGVISAAKNMLQTPLTFGEENNRSPLYRVVERVFPEYQKRLIEHNALDFDDLLQKTVQLWEECPDVLEKYRNRWHYLLVDEYQDTNFAQYRLVRLLAEPRNNLCVIGDDHQSIYSFRGADYTNILNFEKDFPNAAVIKLEQNYRSSGNILKNANTLIAFNETGRPKKLWTEAGSGTKVRVHKAVDDRMEGNFIADQICAHASDGGRYSDCAILYRMNAQSRSLEEALMRRQIPYQIVGGTRFFDRKEIKDIVAYLRLIFNPRDDVAFDRIINVPSRKIGGATLEIVKDFAKNYSMSMFEILEEMNDLEIPESKKTALKDFRDLIKFFQEEAITQPISILLDHVIEKTQYLKFLDDGTSEGEARQQNVRELFSVAGRYDSADESLAAFLEGVALISDLDQLQNGDAVTLMTIHASKGLEFPCVFLAGWEEGMFPGQGALTDRGALEEERRLGYVAITRSMDHCTITHAQQRMLFGRTQYGGASQFLSELHEDSVERTSDEVSQTSSSRFSRSVSSSGWKNSFGSKQKTEVLEPFSDEIPAFLNQKKPSSRSEAIFGVEANTSDWSVGGRLRHMEFGEGTIIQVSGDVLTVAFAGIGMKKIVASIAPIEKAE
jgi:DNA helicase-2/ATP-dependent DNA helicase PcrA